MATNLDIQAQLNQLLVEQNKLLEVSAKLTKDQTTLAQSLVTALRSANFKDVATDINDANEAVARANESTKAYGSTNTDVFDKITNSLKEAVKKEDEVGKGMEDLGKKVKRFAVAASALDGFVQGLRMTGNTLRTVVGAGAGLVESLGQIGAAIISIPFKMLSGLIHMSDQGGGSNELQQALEDIRKEFGSLKETSGAAIVSMARSMKGELAQTGLSVTRVFGNLAERLKTIQEYAHNLGPLFGALAPQFMKNAEAIGAYYKGLGLTEEAQKAVATRSFALGTAITEELREITNYSVQLSKAFDGAAGSAKEISRDMGTLMADFKHFGGISTKEIGQAVVYFRRLGVEVSKVMGVIDRYDNFEDAANGAAQLSQAFGLNVDALQMMKAQNPAERVEMLRKSFFAAGRSIENMTRQERALLAQQSGLDDSALDLVFSMKNQGMSYDQVTKKADAAKKSQLTQTQAMKALADSIERLVKSGSSGSGGFIDRFIQGFTVGIQRSSEFRKIMRELRVDLRVAYTEGIKVGRAFVDMFPGVKDVFKGIGDMFEPRRFKAMFRKVTDAFKDFFKDMTDNPATAMPKLLERLKKDFFSWFEGNSQNGQRILDGFKKFFIALGDIAGGLLKVAMNGIKEGIKTITDLIMGRRSLGLGGAASGAQGFLGRLLGPIVDAVKEAGPSLWEALKGMFGAIWTKAGPWISENFLKVLGVLSGPSFIGMAGRTIVTSIAGSFSSGLLGWAKGGGITKAFESVKGLLGRQVATASEALSRAPTPSRGAGGAGSAVGGVIGGAEEAAKAASGSKVNWASALVKMAAITLFIVVGMAGILYAIFRFAKAMQENKLTITSIAGASLAMVSTAMSMVAVAGAVKLLSAINLNMGMAGKIMTGLLIVGLTGAAMAAGAYALVQAFGNVPASKIAKTVTVMAATGTFFLAAAGVAAIAGVVGAIALAGSGVGALVIAAGLATIAATVEVMVEQGMRVMRAIDQFHPGPGFAEKAKVFVDVMKGVGSFASSVSAMVAATSPGIMSFITDVGGDQQRRTLEAVNTTISTLGASIVRIVDTLRSSIERLSGSEGQIRGAQALGTLLGAVGELGNALKPPTEALQESGWYALLTGQGEDVSKKVNAVNDFILMMGPQLRLFITTISNLFSSGGAFSRGITAEQEKAATVIPAMMRGIGEFATTLRAGSATILQLANEGHQESVLRAVSTYMRNLMDTITESQLFTRIGEVISTIATSMGTLNASQIKGVQAIAPILGPAFSAISQIAGVIASLAAPQGGGRADAGAIYQLVQLVNTFFDRVGADLPRMVTNMRTAFQGINPSEAGALGKGMEGISKFFEVVSRVPQMLQSFRPSGSAPNVGTIVEALDSTMNQLTVLLFASGQNRGGLVGVLRQVIPALTTLTSSMNPTDFAAKMNGLKSIFEVLSSIPTMLRGLSELSGRAGSPVPTNVLDVPLTSLSNVIQSLASPSTSSGPNPLMGGRLATMLRGVTGITEAQKTLITGTVDRVLEVGRSLSGLSGATIADASSGITEALQHANASLYALAAQFLPGEENNFFHHISAIGPLVQSVASQIEQTQLSRVGTVITGMVAQVNQLSSTIRGLQPIEIEQSLQRLGDSIGLGSDGNYTIQNRNFTINLSVAIKLDNNGLDALELAMIRRVGPHTTRLSHGPVER